MTKNSKKYNNTNNTCDIKSMDIYMNIKNSIRI